MDRAAEHLHDGCTAMLRKGDAVHMDMEGSMTPERIAKIYAEETGGDIDAEPAALHDFARRMWNEALEEALKALDDAYRWSEGYGASKAKLEGIKLCGDVVLKLREEP